MESLLRGLNHRARQHVSWLSSPGLWTSSNSAFLPEFRPSNYFTDTSWSILIQPMEPNNHLLHHQAMPAVLLSIVQKTESLQTPWTKETHPPFTLPDGLIWFRCYVALNIKHPTEFIPQAQDIPGSAGRALLLIQNLTPVKNHPNRTHRGCLQSITGQHSFTPNSITQLTLGE